MAKLKLLVIGAGGHGRSVAEAAELTGIFEIVGFLDDGITEGEHVLGYPVLGPATATSRLLGRFNQAIVAIGNNRARETLTHHLDEAGVELATVIHPKAFVSSRASLGEGCVVMPGAVLGTEAWLGKGVIVNCGAVVDHHARVEDFAHLGVNACMAGGAFLGRGAWMQAGAALGYGVAVAPAAILRPGESMEKSTC